MENVKIREIVQTVPGYGCITYEEGCCLYNFTREALSRVQQPVVEIGTYIGRSTLCLAQAVKDSGVPVKVITVDIHAPFAEMVMQWARVFGLEDYITPITGDSKVITLDDVPNISVLFLDGEHGYDPVLLELNKFAPRVVKDGYIMGHDFQSIPTVKQAFSEYMHKVGLRLNACGDFISVNDSVVNNMCYSINREPTVLVLGHKGYLGSYLTKNLKADTVENAKGPYDYVINCIGKPSVEFCQEHPEISEESNLNVVKKMIADYPKSKFIHFSSYYVYDYDGMCNEGYPTTDKYYYMKHKLDSEKLVVDAHGVVFRLGKLFGSSDGKKQGKFTDYILDNQELTVDTIPFNPTSLRQVLAVMKFEISQGILYGIFNLANKGVVTHSDYAQFVNIQTGNAKKINIIARRDRAFHNYGRFVMDCSKLEQYIKLGDWQTDLVEFIREAYDVG